MQADSGAPLRRSSHREGGEGGSGKGEEGKAHGERCELVDENDGRQRVHGRFRVVVGRVLERIRHEVHAGVPGLQRVVAAVAPGLDCRDRLDVVPAQPRTQPCVTRSSKSRHQPRFFV